MPAIALLSMPGGGRTCVDMSDSARVAEPFLRRFMKLRHGAPSHDAFSDLFNALDPASPGKALRRSFEDASERSPLHLMQAFSAEAKLTLALTGGGRQVERDPGVAGTLGAGRREGQGGDGGRDARSAAWRRPSWRRRRLRAGAEEQPKEPSRGREAVLGRPGRQGDFLTRQELDKGHRRVERREAAVCHDVGWLLERHAWPGLAAIGQGDGESSGLSTGSR